MFQVLLETFAVTYAIWAKSVADLPSSSPSYSRFASHNVWNSVTLNGLSTEPTSVATISSVSESVDGAGVLPPSCFLPESSLFFPPNKLRIGVQM